MPPWSFVAVIAMSAVTACSREMKPVLTYTHDAQLVHFRWDQIEERGPIGVEGAIQAFRTFPYKDQQTKARALSAPTFPTLTFRSSPDHGLLSIWSLEPDLCEVYSEYRGDKVTAQTRDTAWIEARIRSFFAGDRAALFDSLAASPGAVPKRSLLGSVRALFGK